MTDPTFAAVETEPVEGQRIIDRYDEFHSVHDLCRIDRENGRDDLRWTRSLTLTGTDDGIHATWERAQDPYLWATITEPEERTVERVWIDGCALSLDTGDCVTLDPPDTYLACRVLGRYPSARNCAELHVIPGEPYSG